MHARLINYIIIFKKEERVNTFYFHHLNKSVLECMYNRSWKIALQRSEWIDDLVSSYRVKSRFSSFFFFFLHPPSAHRVIFTPTFTCFLSIFPSVKVLIIVFKAPRWELNTVCAFANSFLLGEIVNSVVFMTGTMMNSFDTFYECKTQLAFCR